MSFYRVFMRKFRILIFMQVLLALHCATEMAHGQGQVSQLFNFFQYKYLSVKIWMTALQYWGI
jgi:hypothetical protein